MRPEKGFRILLYIEFLGIIAIISVIFMHQNVQNWLYEVLGAILAVTVTTFGIYKMRKMT